MFSISRTKKALQSLRSTLVCQSCKNDSPKLYFLGRCECDHRLCKSCADLNKGRHCPVCDIPSLSTSINVDQRLTSLVSLCQQMSQVVEESESGNTGPFDTDEKETSIKPVPQKKRSSTSSKSITPPSSPPSTRRKSLRLHASSQESPKRKTASLTNLPALDASSIDTVSLSKDLSATSRTSSPTDVTSQDPSSFCMHDTNSSHLDIDKPVAQSSNILIPCVKEETPLGHNPPQMRSLNLTSSSHLTPSSSPRRSCRLFLSTEQNTPKKDTIVQNDVPRSFEAGETNESSLKANKGQRGRAAKKVNNTPKTEAPTVNEKRKLTPVSQRKEKANKIVDERINHLTDEERTTEKKTKAKAAEQETFGNASEISTPKKKNKKKTEYQTGDDTDEGHTPRKKTSKTTIKQQNSSATDESTPKTNNSVNTKLKSPMNRRQNKTKAVKRNIRGETPLHMATIKADVKAVRNLLDKEKNPNPNIKDHAGWTPLHEAVNHGYYEIAKLLIERGADVNAPGLANDTPLHDAVGNHRTECIKLLLSHGADMNARNAFGRLPADMAQTQDFKDMIKSSGSTDPAGQTQDLVTQLDHGNSGQPLCFLGSSLGKEERKLLEKCAKLVGAKVVQKFSAQVTHVITVVDSQDLCRMTENYLWAILCGKWILSTEWLSKCIASESIIPESDCQVAGTCDCTVPDAPHHARTNRVKELPGLFDGCQIFFYGKISYPGLSKEDLVALVKAGGAAILTRQPKIHNMDDYKYTYPFHAQSSNSFAECTIFIIHDDNCPNPPLVKSQRMTCQPVTWLINCICNFCFMHGKNDEM